MICLCASVCFVYKCLHTYIFLLSRCCWLVFLFCCCGYSGKYIVADKATQFSCIGIFIHWIWLHFCAGCSETIWLIIAFPYVIVGWIGNYYLFSCCQRMCLGCVYRTTNEPDKYQQIDLWNQTQTSRWSRLRKRQRERLAFLCLCFFSLSLSVFIDNGIVVAGVYISMFIFQIKFTCALCTHLFRMFKKEQKQQQQQPTIKSVTIFSPRME